ncbi:MAG: ROK family protein [candidate division Zixibacteria bacterium]|nr:ROK family protein [candidate division Zixibacteria bacterium]
MRKKLFAGIDIGATNIKYGLVDNEGKVRYKAKTITPDSNPPAKLFEQVVFCGEQLLIMADEEDGDVDFIGVGSPGTVNIKTGIVEGTCPNLPGWVGFHLRDLLQERLNLPVFIDNDANCATLAECRYGSGVGYKDIICLTVGTGIGGTIILNGRLHRGVSFAAGEIGHMKVAVKDTEALTYDFLEHQVSSKAIISAIAKNLENDITPAFQSQIGDNPERLTIRRIFTAIKRGDKMALRVIEDTARLLGMALVSLVNVLNPELIILGGGVAEGGGDFVRVVKETVMKESLPPAVESLRILPAQMGNNAGFIGAAFLGDASDTKSSEAE